MDEDAREPNIALARKLARELIKKAKITEPPILIKNISPLLRDAYGLTISAWDLGDNISGVLITEDELSAIAYNAEHHVHRNRFTVAHEIGHLLLGHTCNRRGNSLESRSPEEIEANQFAAELLIPLELLKKHLKSGVKAVPRLAEIYWVSKEALGWRISDPHSRLLSYI